MAIRAMAGVALVTETVGSPCRLFPELLSSWVSNCGISVTMGAGKNTVQLGIARAATSLRLYFHSGAKRQQVTSRSLTPRTGDQSWGSFILFEEKTPGKISNF